MNTSAEVVRRCSDLTLWNRERLRSQQSEIWSSHSVKVWILSSGLWRHIVLYFSLPFTISTWGGGWTAGPPVFIITLPLLYIFFKYNLLWKRYWNCSHVYIKGCSNVLVSRLVSLVWNGGPHYFLLIQLYSYTRVRTKQSSPSMVT
jgi:hypothetical protein